MKRFRLLSKISAALLLLFAITPVYGAEKVCKVDLSKKSGKLPATNCTAGDVVSVEVDFDSGSELDIRAINAVERVGRFPEVAALSASDFEKHFRRLLWGVRPDGLIEY